jgi:lipopolysaccharide/colanic/teichoic acid biosynthesis glycosyltransferase
MIRRLIDVLGSVFLLVLLSPVLLITALAVWISDPGPVFFRQTRTGRGGRPFQMIKFRSMRLNNLPVDTPEEIGEGRGHPLVTSAGRWLRRLKLDELPQLLNVLRGEMTFVGPRPAVPEQVARYTAFQRRRLEIPPGLTGWAQVNGGAEISWPERIVLEVWYVDHRSLGLDLRILCRTAGVILFGHKANQSAFQEALIYARRLAPPEELGLPLPLHSAPARAAISPGRHPTRCFRRAISHSEDR